MASFSSTQESFKTPMCFRDQELPLADWSSQPCECMMYSHGWELQSVNNAPSWWGTQGEKVVTCQCRESLGLGPPYTGNMVWWDLMRGPTIIPPAIHIWHGGKYLIPWHLHFKFCLGLNFSRLLKTLGLPGTNTVLGAIILFVVCALGIQLTTGLARGSSIDSLMDFFP